MNARIASLLLGLAVCVALGGCAATSVARKLANQAGARTPVKSEPAMAQVRPGASTREELLATLGPTTVVRFDTGYEVWVYRLNAERPDLPPKGEFVVLVAPSGLVTKTRVRITPLVAQDKGPPVPEEEKDEGGA